MNKQRRKDIDSVIERLREIESVFNDVLTDVEGIRDEEQDYLDAMPENMQSGERGEIAQAAIEALEEVRSALDEISIDELADQLEAAKE